MCWVVRVFPDGMCSSETASGALTMHWAGPTESNGRRDIRGEMKRESSERRGPDDTHLLDQVGEVRWPGEIHWDLGHMLELVTCYTATLLMWMGGGVDGCHLASWSPWVLSYYCCILCAVLSFDWAPFPPLASLSLANPPCPQFVSTHKRLLSLSLLP